MCHSHECNEPLGQVISTSHQYESLALIVNVVSPILSRRSAHVLPMVRGTHADEGGQGARVVKSDMLTDPSISSLFNHPIRQTDDKEGVTIVAE